MALITYIVLLHSLTFTFGKQCDFSNVPDYITWEEELLANLNCNYNPKEPPQNTTVAVLFVMKYFNFDSYEEVFTVQNWMAIKWKDERLKWNPDDYHGIKSAEATYFNIWIPSIGLANREDFLNFEMYSFYRCFLKNTGEVLCLHWLEHEAWCSVQLTNWPYDVQECSLEFAPEFGKDNYTLNSYFRIEDPQGAEWYLSDQKKEKNESKRQVKYTFTLMREAVGLASVFIWPAMILSILSVLCSCMDVRRKVRLAMICFTLYGEYFFLREVAYYLPKESQFPPNLLLYYRGSIVVTSNIILLTLLLDVICRLNCTPHSFIKTVNDFVFIDKYRKCLVFPQWDFNDSTVESKSYNEEWVKFANIVNSAFIYAIVIAYIGMYASMMPKQVYVSKE